MVKKKTQSDYWNEGVKFAREENWKKAIENYEKAVALKTNPALYTNLASCYKKLDNLEKEKEYYLLAIPGLLNREYTYTSSPANSTAWWLFENDIDLENAEKLSKIAIEIDANSKEALDTYVQILLKRNKKEDGIKYLTKLKSLFPDYEASLHLYEKYNSEIEKYLQEYWKDVSMEEKAKEILKDYPKNEIDFILYGGKYIKTSNFYPHLIKDDYNNLLSSFIGNNEDITKRFFKMIFKQKEIYQKTQLVNAISSDKKDDSNMDRVISILTNSKIDILSILEVIIENDYENNKKEYIKNLLETNIKSNQYNNIIDSIRKNAKLNKPKQVNIFAEFLFDKDYDKYVTEVNEIVSNTVYYYRLSNYIKLLKKDSDIIEIIIDKFKSYNNTYNKFNNDDFFDEIKSFLETNIITDNFLTISKQVKYTGIHNYFVYGLDDKHKFYKKLLKLAFLFDTMNTFDIITNNSNNNNNKIDELIELGMNLEQQFSSYLDKYSDTYVYNKDMWKKYLVEVISRDFDHILENLDNYTKDKKKLSFLIPLLWSNDNDKFYPYLLKLTSLTSKQVKESIVNCLKGYENGFDDFKAMLKSKKQAERIIGVELLASLNLHAKVVPLLNELLKKERAAKVKSAIDFYFKNIKRMELELRKDTVLNFTLEDFILEAKENYKNNLENIDRIEWLNFNSIPKLKLTDNNEISIELTYSLLNSLSKSKGITLFYEAEKLLSFINKTELKDFSKSLYEMWKTTDESTEWVLILLSIYYNDNKILDELLERLNQSILEEKQTLIKAFTQNILLIGKKEGFRRVARILNNKYNSNISSIYYNIGEKLNMGTLLVDLTMKRFGFNEKGEKIIDYGPRSFVLTLTPEFKFTVVADNGKSYKNLPKPSKKDDQIIATNSHNDFKNMKKDLKDYLKGRKSYLERKMLDETSWDLEDWKIIFLENAIMNNFAKGLIWSTDNSETFRIMDDNTYSNIEDEEFELQANCKITLVHPIDLSNEDIELWKEQLDDYEIIQPIDQLNRTVFKPTTEQLELTSINDFLGYMALRISFRSKLMDKYFWYRGPAEDAGCYYSYQKSISSNITVKLNFMGECYGGGSDRFKEIWMGELSFYKNNKSIKLKDVPERILSEIYMEVKDLASSGSGYNKDYEDTVW